MTSGKYNFIFNILMVSEFEKLKATFLLFSILLRLLSVGGGGSTRQGSSYIFLFGFIGVVFFDVPSFLFKILIITLYELYHSFQKTHLEISENIE